MTDFSLEAILKLGVVGTFALMLLRFVLSDWGGRLKHLESRVGGMSGAHGPDIKDLQKRMATLEGRMGVVAPPQSEPPPEPKL